MILYTKREKIDFTKILFLTSKSQTLRSAKKTPSPTLFLIPTLIIMDDSYVDFITLCETYF